MRKQQSHQPFRVKPIWVWVNLHVCFVFKFVVPSLFMSSISQHVAMAIASLNSPVFFTISLWFPESRQSISFFGFGVMNFMVSR